jgi:hypothetical protein
VKSANPEKLGTDFWFSLFMITLCLVGTFHGFSTNNGYNFSIGAFLAVLYVARAIQHWRRARLHRGLSKNPELKRIYHASNK